MAWVSNKVYAILSSSEDGKDIVERLPDMSQEECDKEVDAFFGEGGKGAESKEKYDEAKQSASDEDIREALDDASWSITDDDSVDSYSKLIADKLGIEQEKVISVMEKEAGRKLDMEEQMAKLAFPDDSEPPADLDKSVYEQNYKQAYEINNYEKVKEIYERQVQDKGEDSPEAQGTKKALIEMEANFDQAKTPASVRKLEDLINGKIARQEGWQLEPDKNRLMIGKTSFAMTKEQYKKLKELGYNDDGTMFKAGIK